MHTKLVIYGFYLHNNQWLTITRVCTFHHDYKWSNDINKILLKIENYNN
jgi:hypothetical protein